MKYIAAGRMCNGVEIDDQISWSSLSLSSAKLVLVCWQVTFSNCAIATCLGLSTSSASPLFLEIVIWCGGFANASNCAEKWPFFAIDPEKVESCWLHCYLDLTQKKSTFLAIFCYLLHLLLTKNWQKLLQSNPHSMCMYLEMYSI